MVVYSSTSSSRDSYCNLLVLYKSHLYQVLSYTTCTSVASLQHIVNPSESDSQKLVSKSHMFNPGCPYSYFSYNHIFKFQLYSAMLYTCHTVMDPLYMVVTFYKIPFTNYALNLKTYDINLLSKQYHSLLTRYLTALLWYCSLIVSVQLISCTSNMLSIIDTSRVYEKGTTFHK